MATFFASLRLCVSGWDGDPLNGQSEIAMNGPLALACQLQIFVRRVQSARTGTAEWKKQSTRRHWYQPNTPVRPPVKIVSNHVVWDIRLEPIHLWRLGPQGAVTFTSHPSPAAQVVDQFRVLASS
ncbi:MAG: hypothetical protein KDA57_20460 [Planctomycetales bacterium]|nr:hypothetical protein [Planctomycetales bacterium]